MANAGDRPPRYGKIKTRRALLPDRHRDQESRLPGTSRPGGLSYRGNGIVRDFAKPFLQTVEALKQVLHANGNSPQRVIKHPQFSFHCASGQI